MVDFRPNVRNLERYFFFFLRSLSAASREHLSTSVKKHESSKQHLTNILSLKRLENNTTTIKDALTEHNEEVRKNRILLSYLIDDVTVTLAKQELAFRGHDEK
jgi:hypothetical protein